MGWLKSVASRSLSNTNHVKNSWSVADHFFLSKFVQIITANPVRSGPIGKKIYIFWDFETNKDK